VKDVLLRLRLWPDLVLVAGRHGWKIYVVVVVVAGIVGCRVLKASDICRLGR